ncbi:MAG: formylglycine-generating enzyme family protein [Thiobacillaceae bacterium]|nr:formylglycine-generating enzyme family protein [Thiobacillaceae bacterium]
MDATHTLAWVHELGPAELRRLQAEAARAAGLEVFFQDRLRDGGLGPQLAVIPPGRFSMGAADATRRFGELPQRPVTMQAPYAIGRYTVTADEFERYVQAAGLTWPDHLLRSEGRQPVINLSLLDAQGYLEWLSAQTGQRYRLPTEAEWEYAARAGSRTEYCFGERLSCGEANTATLLGTGRAASGWRRWLPFCVPLQRVCEVGSYPANVWGLYEVHGNVWELTADPWEGPLDAHGTRPARGSRWVVTKGGSWFEGVEEARFAARRPRMMHEIDTNLGFRVVREVG